MATTAIIFFLFSIKSIIPSCSQETNDLPCNYGTFLDVDEPKYLTYPTNICYITGITSSHKYSCNYTTNTLMNQQWNTNNQCLDNPDQTTITNGLTSTNIYCNPAYSSKTCTYIIMHRRNALMHLTCSPDSALEPQIYTFITNNCLLYNDNTAIYNEFNYLHLPYQLTQIQYNTLNECLNEQNGVNINSITHGTCNQDSYYEIFVSSMPHNTNKPTMPTVMLTKLPTKSPIINNPTTAPTMQLHFDTTTSTDNKLLNLDMKKSNKSDHATLIGAAIGSSVTGLLCACVIVIIGVHLWKRKIRLVEAINEVDDDSIDVTDSDYQFEGHNHLETDNTNGLYTQEKSVLLLT